MYVVIADSKLSIVLSATALAMVFAFGVVVFVQTLVVMLCAHKRKAVETKSAKIELIKMRELMTETVSPTHTFNTYTSPVHNHYSSEEKVDIM